MSPAALMEELDSNEGRRAGNRRRGPGRLFVSTMGILVIVLAVVIAIVVVHLNQIRHQMSELQMAVDNATKAPPPTPRVFKTEGDAASADQMRQWIATLRTEIADTRSQTSMDIAETKAEGKRDRARMQMTIAHALHGQGATPAEIQALTADLDPDDRRRLAAQLDIELEDGVTGSPTGSDQGTTPPPDSTGGTTPPDEGTTPSPPDEGTGDPNMTVSDDGHNSTGDDSTGADSTGDDTTSDDTTSGDDDPPPPPPLPPVEPVEEVIIYKIRRGDTISAIALKFKTTEKEILERNKIKNPRLIQVGQKLEIPKKK